MNFDYLRLFLAVTVMCGHLVFPALQFLPFWHNELAVLFFFCISGYLITLSYVHDGDVLRYAKRRVARIYPPIVLCVVVLIVAGLVAGQGSPFARGSFAMLLLQDWYPLHQAGEPLYAHGAFWSIIIEVQFYVALPMLVLLLGKKRTVTILGLAILYFASHYARRFMYEDAANLGYDAQLLAFRDNLFTVTHFFIAGMAVALYAPKLWEHKGFWLVLVPISTIEFFGTQVRGGPWITHLTPFAICVLVLAAGRASYLLSQRLGIRDPKRAPWGDISYGAYLYHFPAMTILGLFGIENGLVAVGVTVVAAFLSWHLVEKRALAWAAKPQSAAAPYTRAS